MLRSLVRPGHSHYQRAEEFIVDCNSLNSEAAPQHGLEPSSLLLFQIDFPTVRTTLIRCREERQTARHLLTRSLRLTAENYSCKFDEIDLIMVEGASQLTLIKVRC